MIGCRAIPSIYSGIDLVFRELCPRLVARGHCVLAYCRRGYPFPSEFKGVILADTPCFNGKRSETLSYSFNATIAALREKPDLIHFHTAASGIFAFLSKLKRVPTVITIHSLNWQHSKWTGPDKMAIRLVERLALARSDAVVAVSGIQRDYLSKNYKRDVRQIPNGVILPSDAPARHILNLGLAPGRYVLFSGRLSREKGCGVLIEAFKRLGGDIKLAIAGAAPGDSGYLDDLRKNASERILFLGHVSQDVLGELYSHAAVFVLPSESEGMSLSLLEAMSHGCSVVTSAIPENTEIVADCGLTFPVGDAAELGKQLSLLINDAVLRRRLGEKARERVGKLNCWDDICSQYEQVYRTVVR
jgi:glycosyltransferase involved in cell wall biosynthesis